MLAAGPATAATRRMDAPSRGRRSRPSRSHRAAARAQPAPRPAVAPAPGAAQRSAGGRFLRAVGILLLIAILAALIAGAVLLLTDAGQSTDLGQTIKDNLNEQIQAIEDFIQENTQ